MANLSSGLAGVSGEYYVCAELSHRGYIATLTLKNTEGIDILATRLGLGRSISIQVKTTQQNDGKWLLTKKSEENNVVDFYIFVCLGELGQRPSFHIVSSKDVSISIKKTHIKWLSGSKRDGTQRKDTPMRGFSDKENKFLEQWELLDAPPSKS
ncbi:MAG: hypothetical protein QX189_06810 [Methylococcales bacterium]